MQPTGILSAYSRRAAVKWEQLPITVGGQTAAHTIPRGVNRAAVIAISLSVVGHDSLSCNSGVELRSGMCEFESHRGYRLPNSGCY